MPTSKIYSFRELKEFVVMKDSPAMTVNQETWVIQEHLEHQAESDTPEKRVNRVAEATLASLECRASPANEDLSANLVTRANREIKVKQRVTDSKNSYRV